MTDVGDVHDAVDVIAREAQVLLEHVLHDIGAEVADVGKVVDGRAAGVHLHMAGGVGGELRFLEGGSIIQIHGDSPSIFTFSIHFANKKRLSDLWSERRNNFRGSTLVSRSRLAP